MNLRNQCFLLLLGFSLSINASLPEMDFKDVNDTLVKVHAPLIWNLFGSTVEINEIYEGFGGAFKVDSALKPLSEKRFIITLTGEIPHSTAMNMDGYAIVVCHEIGHVLGNEPRQSSQIVSWSSVEGQADYYATNECMWKYVESLERNDVIKSFNKDIINRCEHSFGNNMDKVFGCLRIMTGIQAMTKYFNERTTPGSFISIYKQDDSVVEKTLEKYPSAQCRVDTWIAGLFDAPRPRCWFKA